MRMCGWRVSGGLVLIVWLVGCLLTGRYQPVDEDNERGMLAALRSSVQALLEGYPTSLEEDELLLQLSSFGPATRSAIVLRAREKDLLLRALGDLRDWEAALDAGKLPFQLAAIKASNKSVHPSIDRQSTHEPMLSRSHVKNHRQHQCRTAANCAYVHAVRLRGMHSLCVHVIVVYAGLCARLQAKREAALAAQERRREIRERAIAELREQQEQSEVVSYTHLTLPTIYSV